jgi:hypothetical protein
MLASDNHLSSIYLPLRVCYGAVPIVAGLDKFTNFLTEWDKYVPPFVRDRLPIAPSQFMALIGIIEIAAGLAVLTYFTRLGAYVVAAWLALIAVNLVIAGFYDIAVRDLVMALGAYTLGQVAALRGDGWLRPGTLLTGTAAHVASR